jgi:hypothetical protein
MRLHPWISLAAVSLLIVACASPPAARHRPAAVTIEHLVSAPDRFDGSLVEVTGFLLQPMVGEIKILQIEPDYPHSRRELGIRLDLDPSKRNLMPFQLQRCLVRGTFHASHAQGLASRIGEITTLELAQ